MSVRDAILSLHRKEGAETSETKICLLSVETIAGLILKNICHLLAIRNMVSESHMCIELKLTSP